MNFIILISVTFGVSILFYAVDAAPFSARSEGPPQINDTGSLSRQVLTAIVVGLCISIFAVSLFLAVSGCRLCRRRGTSGASTSSSNGYPQMQRIPSRRLVPELDTMTSEYLPPYESDRLPEYPPDLHKTSVSTGPLHAPPPAHIRS
ncbi:hypothetical protein FB446DRAFT_155371 [Lentinula raphanica]|uniref:Uncharacterized protein n=1 Tax=Lentinula raphanica TaxID=153919 RepID=A0AA38NYA6_9AGAR|nr:hypothetical protein FB446DRAFT_155371 [Lentinula raphanica]KAJ3829348.1 hypothetical protein F5880DRAFT_478556 [Lentinula raphanica]KAJ3832693.1 hypothetical protein F5878DRAFT_447098 [Lentinula raphanica]